MTHIYFDPTRESDPYALPDCEVFYAEDGELRLDGYAQHSPADEGDAEPSPAGWYWWACFPGCLPDGDPVGPFETEEEAIEDAQSC